MKLYILRHGDAGERGDYANDDERPLTPKGIARTKALVRALRRWDVDFDTIVSSPLVRARETADIVHRGLGAQSRMTLIEELAPSGDVTKLILYLNSILPAPESLLLVGHEPDLSSLISLLCTGGPHLPLTLKKGGLCRMEIESLRAQQCAELEWLLTPGTIEAKRPKKA